MGESRVFYKMGLFNYSIDQTRVQTYKSLKPKTFVRTIDFLDDVTDLYSGTRDLKDEYQETIEKIEGALDHK